MYNLGGKRRGRNQRQAQNPSAQNPLATHPLAAALPPPPFSPATHREHTTKRRGELAEIAFLHEALALGFRVSKPYGDSDRYDFITDPGNLLYRVQVKCTTQLQSDLYHLNVHRRVNGKAVPYTLEEIDFIAALVIPEDSWFLIPLSHILGITSLLLPKRKARKHPYTRYREAWPLLCQPDGLTFG